MAATFNKGDEVVAKHPKSLDFNSGKVVDVKGSNYRVKFSDGEEYVIAAKDVKNKRISRSTTRSKSEKGKKSPTRASPTRKKSSGRPKTRSPARSPRRSPRRSPARNRKPRSPVVETKLAKISIARIDSDKDFADETSTNDATESLEDNDIIPLSYRLRDIRPTGLRRSTRLNTTPKTDNRATSLPLEKKFSKNDNERGFSVHEHRDTDNYQQIYEKHILEMSLMKNQEWGGWIGALFLIILLPITFLGPQVACTNNRCKSTYFRFPKDWRTFFNLNAFYAYAAYLIAIAILSILPIGRRMDSHQNKTGRLQYRINGFVSLILILATYIGSVYKGYKVSNFILENMLQLTICGWIYGTVLAIVLYLKGCKAPTANQNIYGCSNSIIYNFWQGKEVNPRIGPLDFKIVLMRSAVIGSLLILAAVVTKMWEKSVPSTITDLDAVLMTSVIMQAIYLLDFFAFESMTLTTFEITQEGTGYMLVVGYLMYPFVSTLQSRFLLYNRIPLNKFVLIPCIITFIIGYCIYRISNYQKDAFRRNPFSPSVSHLQSISTSRGKKLIVSGLWGYVRHPNYLGDVILHWAAASITLIADVIPYVCAITCTITLFIRVIRDNARCKSRYNVAWSEYSSRVKYMLLKKIF